MSVVEARWSVRDRLRKPSPSALETHWHPSKAHTGVPETNQER